MPNYFLPLLSFSYSKHRSQYIYKTNVLRRWWRTQINNNKSLWTKHTDTEVETKRTSVRFEMSLNCALLLDLWNDCVKKFNANSTLYQQNCNFMPFEFQASLFCWLSNGYRFTAGYTCSFCSTLLLLLKSFPRRQFLTLNKSMGISWKTDSAGRNICWHYLLTGITV